MALFQSDTREALKRVAARGFASVEERDEILTQLASFEGLKARDIGWMLFRPDRVLRDAAGKLLQKLKDPETVDVFLMEARNKPDAAMRGAVPYFFALGIPGLEKRMAEIIGKTETTPAGRDVQTIARRLLLEAPPSKTLEPLIWELAAQNSG
jgi:hypothetical protein